MSNVDIIREITRIRDAARDVLDDDGRNRQIGLERAESDLSALLDQVNGDR